MEEYTKITTKELELLDIFAAMALSSYIKSSGILDDEEITKKSYSIAEDMLKARKELLEFYDVILG